MEISRILVTRSTFYNHKAWIINRNESFRRNGEKKAIIGKESQISSRWRQGVSFDLPNFDGVHWAMHNSTLFSWFKSSYFVGPPRLLFVSFPNQPSLSYHKTNRWGLYQSEQPFQNTRDICIKPNKNAKISFTEQIFVCEQSFSLSSHLTQLFSVNYIVWI